HRRRSHASDPGDRAGRSHQTRPPRYETDPGFGICRQRLTPIRPTQRDIPSVEALYQVTACENRRAGFRRIARAELRVAELATRAQRSAITALMNPLCSNSRKMRLSA